MNINPMNNEYVNNSDSAYDSIEQDYNTIREALAAKPAILQAILQSTRVEAYSHTVDALKKEQATKPGNTGQLMLAESRYQKVLDQQADALFALYQKLPVDRKIDLLIYAEEIGEINDQARKLTNRQMQEDHAKAITIHQQEAIHNNAVVTKTEHENKRISTENIPNDLKPNDRPVPQTQPQPAHDADIKTQTQAPHENGLVNQIGLGSPAAVTVNFPFTVIPGLPALSKILEKIDRTTHFDLGFTIKGVADREPNPDGGRDVLYRLSYIGAGIMSSKFNVQVSPIAIKLEESADKPAWGGSASLFTRQHSDGLGSKVTLNINDSDAGLSYAHEYSYQTPSNKFISTLTGGKHFSNDAPAIRIPATYVPTIDRILSALPNKEEADIIFNRIDKVIPVNQAVKIAYSLVETINMQAHQEQMSITAAKFVMQQEIAKSGLSAAEQKAVYAKICENCENTEKQGKIPLVQITDESPPQQPAQHDQNQH